MHRNSPGITQEFLNQSRMSLFPLYPYFLGTWQLHRTITDHLTNKTGTMEGNAVFNALGPQLLYYQETGTVILENYEGIFQQEYLYKNLIDQKGQVCFKNQKLFYELDLETGNQQVLHTCGNDVYQGHITLVNKGEWTITWNIKGPKKEMCISSSYQKQLS